MVNSNKNNIKDIQLFAIKENNAMQCIELHSINPNSKSLS